VISRYGFSKSWIALEELQWHLYAFAIMLAPAFSQINNSHIRIDLFFQHFTQRTQCWIDVIGIIIFALPFFVIVFIHSLDFVYDSWRINEHSSSPAGLPWRWLIKTIIPVSLLLMFLSLAEHLQHQIKKLKNLPCQ
jgi:TRAP-type mannitol/chloroaromatic compound transport system permease small subunit